MGKKINRNKFLLTVILIGIVIIAIISNIPLSKASSLDLATTEPSSLGFVPLYWTIGIVGGCIALTLTYVSWRQYRATKNKAKNESNS